MRDRPTTSSRGTSSAGLLGFPLDARENVSLGQLRAIPGSPDRVNRHAHDFYRTPRRAVEALLSVERFDGVTWEPACGDGAISEILVERGMRVVSTDLVDRGYGVRLDFLTDAALSRIGPVDNVVTNPPFRLAQTFAEQALRAATGKVALLGRTLWLEGQRRRLFFESSPLVRVWTFSRRVNVARAGDARWRDGEGGMASSPWFVWDHAQPRDRWGRYEGGWL